MVSQNPDVALSTASATPTGSCAATTATTRSDFSLQAEIEALTSSGRRKQDARNKKVLAAEKNYEQIARDLDMLADTVRSIVAVVVGAEEKSLGKRELMETEGEIVPTDAPAAALSVDQVENPQTIAFSKRSAEKGLSNHPPRKHKRSEYSVETRALCVRRHQHEGASYGTISKELGIPHDTVRAIVRKAKRTGTVESAPRSGRPRKTTGIVDKVILEAVKNNKQCTAKSIQEELLRVYNVKLSPETVRRRVLEHTKNRMQSTASGATSETTFLATTPEDNSTAARNVDSEAQPVLVQCTVATADASLCESEPFQQLVHEDSHPSTDAGQGAAFSAAYLNPEPDITPPVVNMNQLPSALLTNSSGTELDEVSQEKSPTPTLREVATPPKQRKRSEYSIQVREQCVALHDEGKGYRRIGKALNIPHTTVRAIVEKAQRTGSVIPAKRTGRPRKTDAMVDKVILQAVKANGNCSARMIKEQLLVVFGIRVSCETIRRRVKDQNGRCMSASRSTESPDLLPDSIADSALASNPATPQDREQLEVVVSSTPPMTLDENGAQHMYM